MSLEKCRLDVYTFKNGRNEIGINKIVQEEFFVGFWEIFLFQLFFQVMFIFEKLCLNQPFLIFSNFICFIHLFIYLFIIFGERGWKGVQYRP